MVLPPDEGVIRPQPVSVRIGAPIPTEGLGISQRRELTAATRREIDRLRGPEGHISDEETGSSGT